MRTVRCALLLGLLGSLATNSVIAQSAAAPEPGPWQVGFTFIRSVDSTRRMESGEPRPLDIGVWYPTRSTERLRLGYRDYFLLAATEPELENFIQFLASHGAESGDVAAWLAAPMHAIRDAGPTDQRFPLVLIAQGNGHTVPDQASMAEYLASHGYVVATTPSPMRVTGPLEAESQMGARAVEQSTDLEIAELQLLQLRRDITGDAIGVVGHSFGARAGLLLAMRSTRVAALVSLDGGIGTATGRGSMESVAGFRPGAVRAAILHFYETVDDYMTPDFSLLRSLTGAKRWIRQAPLRHHLFSSLGAASIGQPALRSAMAATDSTGAAYIAVAEETLAFLNAHLKHDATARSRLNGAAPRPPLGLLERL